MQEQQVFRNVAGRIIVIKNLWIVSQQKIHKLWYNAKESTEGY